jgi:hypothetical protein
MSFHLSLTVPVDTVAAASSALKPVDSSAAVAIYTAWTTLTIFLTGSAQLQTAGQKEA